MFIIPPPGLASSFPKRRNFSKGVRFSNKNFPEVAPQKNVSAYFSPYYYTAPVPSLRPWSRSSFVVSVRNIHICARILTQFTGLLLTNTVAAKRNLLAERTGLGKSVSVWLRQNGPYYWCFDPKIWLVQIAGTNLDSCLFNFFFSFIFINLVSTSPLHWIWSTEILLQNFQIFHDILLNFATLLGGPPSKSMQISKKRIETVRNHV